jgi:hypothetical protein
MTVATPTPAELLASRFPSSYAHARANLQEAAQRLGVPVQAHVHPTRRGMDGEELSMDLVRIGPAGARAALIVSSGMHGVEGFCGSGCQVALMHDEGLLARLDRDGVALLLIHAVNPHGFSHLRRTNEDNIDLNRNFIDFDQPLPLNEAYADIHELLLPAHWPPGPDNAQAIERYIAEHGEVHFRDALSSGQTSHPDGLFFLGHGPGWSNTSLRALLRAHCQGFERLAWIDIHTGLGPWGHGEKIFASHLSGFAEHHDPAELRRAKAFWGSDVCSIFGGQSLSRNSRGGGIACLPVECPQAECTMIGLEFGTLPSGQVRQSLRTMHWLANHPEVDDVQRRRMGREALGGFYIDSPAWQGMVYGQTRVMVQQAGTALASNFPGAKNHGT